ncbi:MAG TPA: hypothetical protein VE822_05110 [Candidatus Elarobacter sp.]|nr:hypothetical protein [Candidatus Elarobacter sp.]
MPRKSPWRLPLFLFAVSLLAPVRALARPQSNFTYGPLPVFELHSGFWINLHHTLYHEAKLRTASAQPDKGARTSGPTPNTAPDAKPALTSSEQYIWDGAVAYYVSNYATKDLLFSTELIQLKDQLGDFEDCDELSGRKRRFCDAGLPAKLTQVLESAAPVYRAHLWPEHDRVNRRWIMHVAPLVREQGVGLSERLADIYQARWPREKIRVDLTGYANWSGAYTTADPLRVTISSLDSRNQGAAALEVLFHEGSHGIAEPVQAAIIRECHQRDKAIPRDLWHALVFYTTGEVIRPVLGSSGATAGDHDGSVPGGGYTPYALREGLYQRGWSEYFKLLQKFWQPYLDGHASFDDAIARMVSSL